MGSIPRTERDTLENILRYSHQARKLAQELDFDWEKFNSNLPYQYATIWCIGAIGEGATEISPSTRNALPQIPWRKMIAMRHRLFHHCFDVDRTIVWRVVTESLPELINNLEPIVSTDTTPP